jgi:vacuolar-type H+-ATPase subunit B/Vma2
MPSDDVTHPIPDLTGYITEGQVFLGRELFRQGIYPPIYVLSSLSRLMGPAMNHIVKEESRAIERILRLLDELKTKSAREKVSNGDGVVEEIDGLISSIKATRDKVGSGDEGLWDVVERGMKSLASSFKPETNPTFKTLEDEFEGYVKSGMGSLVDQLRQLGPLLFQLYNAYTRAIELRALAEIVGKASLTLLDQEYLTFGDEFERNFVNQGYDENRALQDTLNIAWQTISCIRKSQLTNISQELLNRHYVPGKSRD